MIFSNRIDHNRGRESTLPETDEGHVGFDTLKHENINIFLSGKREKQMTWLETLDQDLNKDPNKASRFYDLMGIFIFRGLPNDVTVLGEKGR